MSKRDYELFAAFLREAWRSFSSNTAHARFVGDLARELAADNGRFQGGRFVMASMPRFRVGTSGATAWERVASTFEEVGS